MGRSVPSFRMVLESEIREWSSFRKSLNVQEQAVFDELMDMARGYNMASGAACNPVPFEPMIMSILVAQQKWLTKIETTLNMLK